jgi:hypothetical protein
MNLFNKAWEKRRVRAQVYKKKTTEGKLLTSLGEIVDAWALRKTSTSLAFFEHLRLRV